MSRESWRPTLLTRCLPRPLAALRRIERGGGHQSASLQGQLARRLGAERAHTRASLHGPERSTDAGCLRAARLAARRHLLDGRARAGATPTLPLPRRGGALAAPPPPSPSPPHHLSPTLSTLVFSLPVTSPRRDRPAPHPFPPSLSSVIPGAPTITRTRCSAHHEHACCFLFRCHSPSRCAEGF